MFWLILLLTCIGLTVLLVIANIVVTLIKKKRGGKN